MEGISGIVSYEQADPCKSEYQKSLRLFMSDLNAVLNGLFDGGADEVHIYDEHYFGRNIDISELKSSIGLDRIFIYMGKPPYRKDWAGGLTSDFSGLILLGFHAKKGTENALLHHTYESDIDDILINNQSVGEIGVESLIAKEMGVPFIMITADSEGVKEALAMEPDVMAVSVKESLCESGAICQPIQLIYDMIYETAKKAAIKNWEKPAMHRNIPVHMSIKLANTTYKREYLRRFSLPEFTGASVLECWAEYWHNKIEVQKSI